MTKAILKKQLMESFSWLYFNRKNGKKRTAKGILGYVVLYLMLFGMLGYMFYMMAITLAEPLCEMGIGWLYFALMSLVAVVLGVFGSVFNTYASLYQPKDNDFLLSMPLPASRILLARLAGVYLMGLMYELIVMIPALLVWFMVGHVSAVGVILSLLLPFVLSLFILSLSCALGWVVALISAHVKNKSAVTVVLSLAFFAAYYYFYMKAYNMLLGVLNQASEIAAGLKSYGYPLYQLGRAAQGSVFGFLFVTAVIIGIFALVWLVLSRSFFKMVTMQKGAAKVKYRERMVKRQSTDHALLVKELKRFTSSANYMLNCGLGILFMLIASVALLWKGRVLAEVLPMIYEGAEEIIPLILAAALCVIVSMNDMSAPSVSLEGKNIWILQSFPVSAWQVLRAKLRLHLMLTLPPAAIMTVCAFIVLRPAVEEMVFIFLLLVLFILTMAQLGLFLNLKTPNLKWTNEIVPIKQSFSVTVTLFGGWGIIIACGGLYFLLGKYVGTLGFMALICLLLAVASVILRWWIKTKGARIFAAL